jgi:hypothetical protein
VPRRLRIAIPPLAFALVVLAVCWRIWTPIPGAARAFSWDAVWEYWGDLAFQVHAAQRGELPLWNPFDRLGYPFLADPQNGCLYPVTWILVAIGLLLEPGWWLVAIKVMFHLWWWGLGTYVWLRRRGTPPAACYAAGILCILAYPTTHGMFSALNWGMAWAPWTMLAVELWAERPSARTAGVLGLALAMAQLAGAPASFWYILLAAVPYAGWAVWHASRATDRRAYLRAVAVTGALAGGLFAVMVVGQVLATSALVPYTIRSTRDLDFIADSVLRGDNLFGMLVPRLPGIEMYLGMVNVFAACVAVTVRPSARTYTLAGIAVGGLMLAVGADGGWLPNLASILPPAGYFRRAHRYVFVTLIAFPALAAEGLAILATLEGEAARRRVGRVLLALGLVGAVVFGCGVTATKPGPHHDAFIIAFFSWTVSAWVLRQLAVADGGWRHVFLWFAVVIACSDVWFARLRQIEANFWPVPVTPRDAEARALPGVPLEARIFDREHLKYRSGSRLQIRELGGYETDPLALRRYARLLDLAYRDPHALGHANVGFVLGVKGPRAMTMPPDFTRVRRDVWSPPRVAPAVAWYPGATVVDGEEQALAALATLVPGSGAVVERPLELGPTGPAVAGRMLELGLNHVVAEIDAPAAGLVVVNEAHHPGWSATVDGRPAEIVPANGAFRGVVVAPGRHRLELRYSAGAALPLMGLGLVAMLAAAWLALRR